MSEFPCVVCNRLYDGTTHCSVMACRACAMFFKRYQEFTQMPLCKRNSKKCYLNDLSIVSCTSCRFYRCLKAGLKRQENARSLTHKAELVKYQSAQKTNLLLKLDTFMLVAETMPTLNRFCYHYAINCNDRKKQELNLLQSDGEKLIKFSGNKSMGYMTQSRSNRLYEGVFAGFQRLARDTFPVFLTMHNDVQDSIFNRLMIFYSDLFGSFNTLRIFNDVNTTKLVCSECMYVDIDDVGRFLDHMESPDPMDNQAIIDYFSVIWRGFLNTTLPVMHRMNISDVEFLAVCTLIIWDKDSFIQLPHLNKMAETHRQMIYHDLEYYYKNIMKLDNYVDRVINIHDLINTIKKNVATMIESVHFFKTFNYYKESEEILEATQKIIDSVELRENSTSTNTVQKYFHEFRNLLFSKLLYKSLLYFVFSLSNQYTTGKWYKICPVCDKLKTLMLSESSTKQPLRNSGQVFCTACRYRKCIEFGLNPDVIIHLLVFFFFDLYSGFKTLRVFDDVNTTKNILHMGNYVERIMKIKELINTLKKNLHVISENVHFLRTFNHYKGNEQIWRTTEKVITIIQNQFVS